MEHRTTQELEGGLDHVRAAPAGEGVLRLIVRRPAEEEREVADAGELDLARGLVGDNWSKKPTPSTEDRSPHPEKQITVMNARVAESIAGEPSAWPAAGDQLYVDLDISTANLPAGTRLAVGGAVIEVTDQPHLGCAKFRRRFGADAVRWVNSPVGKELRLRGLNAKVVEPGPIQPGDIVHKLVVSADAHS